MLFSAIIDVSYGNNKMLISTLREKNAEINIMAGAVYSNHLLTVRLMTVTEARLTQR
jgi:hypothetical protein